MSLPKKVKFPSPERELKASLSSNYWKKTLEAAWASCFSKPTKPGALIQSQVIDIGREGVAKNSSPAKWLVQTVPVCDGWFLSHYFLMAFHWPPSFLKNWKAHCLCVCVCVCVNERTAAYFYSNHSSQVKSAEFSFLQYTYVDNWIWISIAVSLLAFIVVYAVFSCSKIPLTLANNIRCKIKLYSTCCTISVIIDLNDQILGRLAVQSLGMLRNEAGRYLNLL